MPQKQTNKNYLETQEEQGKKVKQRGNTTEANRESYSLSLPFLWGYKLRSLHVAGDLIPGNRDCDRSSSDGKSLIVLLSLQGGSRDFHFCAAVTSRPCHEHKLWGRACLVLAGLCQAAAQSARGKDINQKVAGSPTSPAQPPPWLAGLSLCPSVLHLFLLLKDFLHLDLGVEK